MSTGPNPSRSPSRREHLQALSFALAVTAALFSVTWGKVFFSGDLLREVYPGIDFLRQSWSRGEVPLWSPSLFLGYPFLAQVADTVVLYPFSLVQLFFSIPWSMKLYPAAHYFLTGYLQWRLLREWGLGQAAGLFGALTWMASGGLVSMHYNYNYLIPAAWYPGLFFCFHRLLLTRGRRWFILTNLCWALIFLSGEPQSFLFAGVLLLLYSRLGLVKPLQPWMNSLARLTLIGGFTLLLILAQFLPSLEFGSWCTKLQGYDFNSATRWSHHPLRILEWIWPGLWGPIFPFEHFWGAFLHSFSWLPWNHFVYLGLFPLLLALLQFRRYRQRPLGFLLLALLGFFLMALGAYSPLYRLIWTFFPPYRIFRFPEKHLLAATWALAGLAGFGFQYLFAPDAEPARRNLFRVWLALTVGLAAVFLGGWLSAGQLSEFLAGYLARVYQFTIDPSYIRASLLNALWRSLALALAYLLVFLWFQRVSPLKRRLAPTLILITALDLLSLAPDQFLLTNPSLYRLAPAANRLIQREQAGAEERFRFHRIDRFSYPANLTEPTEVSGPERRFYCQRETLERNVAASFGLEDIFGYGPARLTFLERLARRPPRIQTLQMLNVKYLIDGLDRGEFSNLPGLERIGDDPKNNLRVWLNPGYFPRAFFVDGVQPAQNPDESLDRLETTDLRFNVILIRPTSGPRPGKVFLPAEMKSYQNQQVSMEVANPVPGHLVLSDTYFPGWEASVDGKPARILRANALVRAVALEPGRHRVVFTYRPWPWRIGRDASLVSLLLMPLLFLSRRAKTTPGLP